MSIIQKFDLNKQQSMELALLGFIVLGKKKYFKKSRHDSSDLAFELSKPNDVIAVNQTSAFILNCKQKS